MKLRNMIGMGALLLTAPALAIAAGSTAGTAAGTAAPMNTGPIAAALPPLVPTHQPAAVYPASALPYRAEGNVTVCFTVEADGSVADARVTNTKFWTTDGQPARRGAEEALENAAISTVKQWQYAPRSFDGQPVATPGNCSTIRLRLSPPQSP